jgi:hypothetical protein
MAVYEIGGYEVPASLLASLHSLPDLPQIPANPLGAFTDSIFEAEDAQAQAEYKRRYADVLRQLGYVDPKTGRILKGSLELDADRKRADLWRSSQLAKIEAINQAQVAGNYFSGYHPVNQARMQHPYEQGITDINTALPKALAEQMDEAARAYEQYVLGRNISLAQAAARAAEAARNQPAGGGEVPQSGSASQTGSGTFNNPFATAAWGTGGSSTPVGAGFAPAGWVAPPPPIPPRTEGPPARGGGRTGGLKSKPNKPGTPGFRPF